MSSNVPPVVGENEFDNEPAITRPVSHVTHARFEFNAFQFARLRRFPRRRTGLSISECHLLHDNAIRFAERFTYYRVARWLAYPDTRRLIYRYYARLRIRFSHYRRLDLELESLIPATLYSLEEQYTKSNTNARSCLSLSTERR